LNYPIIKSLIDHNADLNIVDQYGNTPLHLIINIYSKNPDMCRKILIELLERRVHLNILNNDKWAPIHIAVRKG
jgi:ankyrin repeat protein